ncbi:MAG: sulfotransferase [Bacteroidetes bacterium]|nr:sulfotransferase [Bacteroidota bacterium]
MWSYAFVEGRPVTTKGQWMNPLVFANMRLAKMGLITKKVEQPIFILGTGRSGTTILGIVMSMHRDIAFLNEPKALWHSVFPNEDLIGSYSRGDAKYIMTEKDSDASSIKKMHHIFGYYLSTVFSKRVLDKYPELVFRIPFLKSIFPDFKAIFLYRNGWDTAISSAGWSTIHGEQVKDETHNWWGVNNRKWKLLCDQVIAIDDELGQHSKQISAFENEVDKSIVEWIISMKYGMDVCKKYPKQIIGISYEDLTSKPEETIARIVKFCNLPNDNRLMGYAHRTLSPAPSKSPIALNPLLQAPFNRIMQEMGYAV